MIPPDQHRRGLRIALWVWVIVGFLAYLHQFGRLIEPLMRQIGGGS